jgi:hypothetical protein
MRQAYYLTLFLFLVCVLFFVSCGDDSSTTFTGSVPTSTVVPIPTASADLATVKGTVYNNGSPAGAGYNLRLTPIMGTSEDYGEQQTAITDGNGFYSFTVSFTGVYIIECMSPDSSTLIDSQQCYLTEGTVLTVNLGVTPSPVPTPSINEALITGTVYGSTGKAVGEGCSVKLTPLMGESEISSLEDYGEIQNTSTDKNSEFNFSVSYSGSYILEVWSPDNSKLLGSVTFSVSQNSFGSILNIAVKIITPVLTEVIDSTGDDRDPDNSLTTVIFSLKGSGFSETPGSVTFIKESDGSEILAAITSWTDSEVQGNVDIEEGKYLISIKAYGIENAEDIYYRKGLFWENVGETGFSAGGAGRPSLYVYNGTPYVFYQDAANDRKATVMKYDGNSWQNVGDPGFSPYGIYQTSLYVYNGVPYVAYNPPSSPGKATVMKYDGSSWNNVGDSEFSDGMTEYLSLYVSNGVPYLAYKDTDTAYSSKATVMKYDGSSWVSVGGKRFSANRIGRISLYIYDGTPYVAFKDGSEWKATVMKYDGSSWQYVGTPKFSVGNAYDLSLDFSNGVPYVGFSDRGNGRKATVMKYEGSWQYVGAAGFSAGETDDNSFCVSDGEPYVAYVDNANGDKATVMRYDGSSWQYAGKAGFSAGEVSDTSLYVYNGIIYVAYTDKENGDKATVMKGDYLP